MKSIFPNFIVSILLLCTSYTYGQSGHFDERLREEFIVTGMSTAKQTWWYFDHRLKNPLKTQRFFRVYILQLDIWLKDIHSSSGNKYTGTVDKELSSKVETDTFTFEPEEIADWVIVEEDIVVGGFWLRLQRTNVLTKFQLAGKCEVDISDAVSADFVQVSMQNPPEFVAIKDEEYMGAAQADSAIKARYPGGKDMLMEHIRKYLVYPDYAHAFSMEGKVYTQFLVNADGSISDVKILRSIGGGTPDIARYIIKFIPPMAPAGDNKSLRYHLPIVFKLRR